MQIVVRDLSGKLPDKFSESSRLLKEVVTIIMHSSYSIHRLAELARCSDLTIHNWVDGKVKWGRPDIVARVLAACGYEIIVVPMRRH
jgi:hypothetical protein